MRRNNKYSSGKGLAKRNGRLAASRWAKRPKPASLLTAEAYRTRYLLGGNASLSRLLRYTRMVRRGA